MEHTQTPKDISCRWEDRDGQFVVRNVRGEILGQFPTYRDGMQRVAELSS